jgi:hypothetical protein
VDRPSHDEEGDPISPEGSPTGEYTGDSPGEPIGLPDEPVDEDEPLTPEEQQRPSLERRLSMEEPEVGARRRRRAPGPAPRSIVDDDRSPEDVAVEDPEVDVEDVELDRTGEEVGELGIDPAESAEESAIHTVEE